jgi:ribosomal protein S18 acetylase RimI-like enzyme
VGDIAPSSPTTIKLRPVTAADTEALGDFVTGIGAADRTFLDEQLLDPDRMAAWASDRQDAGLVAVDGNRIAGLGSIRPGTGWSGHVGQLRLVVSTPDRGRGVGARLIERLVRLAAERGVAKVVIEVMAANTGAISLFEKLGFEPEATLRDHVRDSRGNHQDLVVLTQWIDDRGGPIDQAGTGDIAG